MRFAIRVFLALTIFPFVGSSRAADVIQWGSPTLISGDSDVVTTGTLLYAYNVGPFNVQATTVNGVTFSPWAFPQNFLSNTTTTGSVTFTEVPGLLTSTDILGTGGGAFDQLSTSYKNLLTSGGSTDNVTTLTLTLGGLTVGQEYLFQWWTNNSSLVISPASGFPMLLTTATVGADAVNLNANVGSQVHNVGQYVTGTFTAFASTKSIAFTGTSGSNVPLINGFQVRVVPEPSTWILGMIASGVIVRTASARRKRDK